MSGIVRFGDMTTGHGSFPPTVHIEASPDVFVNGLPVVRQGDQALVHCDPSNCHTGMSEGGDSEVFANGLPVQRMNDPLTCGDKSMLGSFDVFAG